MFWDNFLIHCRKIGKSPSAVAKEIGISTGAVARWKEGSIPQSATLAKIADYFGVPALYFLEVKASEQQSAPKLSEQEIQSINKDRDMTSMEAWWIISSNLMELYKCKRTETFKGYTAADLEAEVLCFKALREMYERNEGR